MNFKRLYHKTCCVMQWNIGLVHADIGKIIREKKTNLSFKWLPLNEGNNSVADPFIFRTEPGKINLLYEAFSMVNLKQYGKIALCVLNDDFEILSNKEILDSGSHTSYPFVFREEGKIFVIPESRRKAAVSGYEYDLVNKCLINEKCILSNLPLLDSTFFKYNDKYWLFATLGDSQFDNSKLYIYYSDSLFGQYISHNKNPVKTGLNGTRPAGNLIMVDNNIYRPAQNCKNYYGESITINKIIKLDENEFSEEYYFELKADINSEYKSGIHTINALDNIIVVDGIKMVFMPYIKLINFLKKSLTGIFSNRK